MKVIPVKPGCDSAIPLYSHSVPAGFPSPADDHQDLALNLNEFLVPHPSSTYYVRAEGDSMIGLGIFSKDLLVVDRSLQERHGDVVIASVGGEITCKLLDINERRLVSGNDKFPPVPITGEMDLVIEGVVTCSVRFHRAR